MVNDEKPKDLEASRRPTLGNRDERPSSEFLGQERSRISIIAEDSDENTATSPDADEKPSASSSYSEDDDDEKGGILPESLTEEWEEKTNRFSCADTLDCEAKRRRESETTAVPSDEKAERRQSIASATSTASRCSHCGHHRRTSSITLAAGGPMSPTIPKRMSSLQRHGSLRITPRVRPMSPSDAVAAEQRAYSLVVNRVPSHAISDIQIVRNGNNTGGVSEPHSETASIISSIFAPPLRHLASHPSLNGSLSKGGPRRSSLLTPVDEQRHPGKAGARISRFTRPFEPDIDEDDGEDYLRQVRRLEALRAQQRISSVLAADALDEKNQWTEGWPLAFLVIGICLVVFLISVDRTILTTVCDAISENLSWVAFSLTEYRPSRTLRQSSSPLQILDGTDRRTF